MAMDSNTIILFDVDGTLTAPRKVITPEMSEFLDQVASKVTVGLVGGSDIAKIKEQMGAGENGLGRFMYVFSENGLLSFKQGKEIYRGSIQEHLGEVKLQKFINFVLGYLSKIELPVKRGTFVEFRNGMLNICPVGRSCTQAERDQFFEYDKAHGVRTKMVEALREAFPDMGITISIGGQISMDVFPVGWDKRFCLQHLEKDGYKALHFFGDKTAPGGNDHEIFADDRTIGHTVTSPSDTMQQVKELLGL